jgi:hypothetical protein
MWAQDPPGASVITNKKDNARNRVCQYIHRPPISSYPKQANVVLTPYFFPTIKT